MSIEFRCNGCSRILRTPDESAGKKARCPQCGAIVDIPLASTLTDDGADAAAGGAANEPAFGAGEPAAPAGPFGDASAPAASNPFSMPASSSVPGGAANPFADPLAGGQAAASSASNPFAAAAKPAVNPYAAPSLTSSAESATATIPLDGELPHRKIDLGDLLSTTWEIFVQQWPMAIVMGLVFMGINVGINIGTSILTNIGAFSGEPAIMVITQIIGQIISFFGQTWLQYGLMFTALRWARTGTIQVNDFFAVGPFYLRALGQVFLTNLLIFGVLALFAGIPAGVAAAAQARDGILIAALIGGLISLPLLIYIGLSLFLSSYFLVDRRQGVIESMGSSNSYMSGNRGGMFLAGLVVGSLGLLFGIVTCCVGFIVVAPFGSLMASVAYLRITGQPVYRVALKVPGQ